MEFFINLWLEARHEVWALREHVKQLEAMWLRAEADADHWYFEANNPDEARERRTRAFRAMHGMGQSKR